MVGSNGSESAAEYAFQIDPKLDLKLERVVQVSPEKVWAAWTQPEKLKQWFCPRPWKTVEAEIDLYPGGKFRTVMQSPEGQSFPNVGCFLEVKENRRLVWTSMLVPGFRPSPDVKSGAGPFFFTAFLILEPHGEGTKYTAIVKHADEASCKQHETMGFAQGWGAALDQLVELMTSKNLS